MAVIIPNAKIASRWNGALQARLRQAPLEAYLRSHGQKWVLSGERRLSDNLACATIFMVNHALLPCPEEELALTPPQHPVVGQIACAVSSSLALAVQEPTQWRTAALVATARVLEKYIGLSAAAHAAAAAAREYGGGLSLGSHDPDVLRIGTAARCAVETRTATDMENAVRLMRERLAASTRGADAATFSAARSLLVL